MIVIEHGLWAVGFHCANNNVVASFKFLFVELVSCECGWTLDENDVLFSELESNVFGLFTFVTHQYVYAFACFFSCLKVLCFCICYVYVPWVMKQKSLELAIRLIAKSKLDMVWFFSNSRNVSNGKTLWLVSNSMSLSSNGDDPSDSSRLLHAHSLKSSNLPSLFPSFELPSLNCCLLQHCLLRSCRHPSYLF